MRGLSLCLLFFALTMPVSHATPIFVDGFEACCTVGGSISGLTGSGLVLRLRAGYTSENHAYNSNGPYQFNTLVDAGTNYTVSVHRQPSSGPNCSVTNATGVMPAMSVTNVNVSCADGLQWDTGNWGESWR